MGQSNMIFGGLDVHKDAMDIALDAGDARTQYVSTGPSGVTWCPWTRGSVISAPQGLSGISCLKRVLVGIRSTAIGPPTD
jgi:hypothetical protein